MALRLERVRTVSHGVPRSVIWIGLIGISSALFLLHSGGELGQAGPALREAEPGWLLGAVAAQAACLLFVTAKYRVVFRRLGLRLPALALTRAHLRRHFVSSTVPIGGPAGLVNFVRDMAQHRVTTGSALAASLRASLANSAAYVLFIGPAIAWIAVAGRLSRPVAVGFALVVVAVLALFGLAVALLRCERIPERVRSRVPARLAKAVDEIHSHGIRVADVVPAVPFALGGHAAGVAMLACAAWATGADPSLTTILTARLTVTLAQTMVPVFQGAGVTELGLVGVLHAGGVDLPSAIAAALIFRTAQFWLPLSLGGLLMARWTPVIRLAWNQGPTALTRAATAGLALVPVAIALLELGLV